MCMVMAAGGVLALGACASGPREERLTAPRALQAPYDTSKGEVLWAVIPLRNESGTSIADELVITDKLIGAVEEVRGLRCLPLNRTLAAMEALQLQSVRTPGEARQLAQALGVDAVVAGNITAYDPYTPMMGLSLALYAKPGSLLSEQTNLDTRKLSQATADTTPTSADAQWTARPVAVFSDRFDAKNHATLLEVQSFGSGRSREKSALGWRRYTASMDLYSEFVMFKGVDGLLQQEWTRVARLQMPATQERPVAGAE
ncbi:MAG TPA: hypothetical protein VK157_15995 [Phycisphaerales bacterium]|nr:hypothetical protein [Phycisphaerales bacterium]